MRHRNRKKILKRKKAHRESLLSNLATSLIIHEKIQTTEAKAKFTRPTVENIIRLGRENTLAHRRKLLSILSSPSAVNKVLEVIGPRYKNRQGGYTRILKTGRRKGDRAVMVRLELV